MRKIIIVFFLFLLCMSDVGAIDFQGYAYIVIDGNNGVVLEEKNAYKVQSVASISKIMTAMIAIENGHLNDLYTIGDEVNKAWGSGVYIHIGDKISLQDLLYGLLLRSGNDAALVIAKNIAGDIETFVSMMNAKAKEIGMMHTVFANPTGLDEEDNGNQSCVYDMALLMKYASMNPIFNDIVSTKQYQRKDGGGQWSNKNKLLYNYEYCVGGKTGYTKKAKRTLVTKAIKDKQSLIIVTFQCGNDFEFHQEKYQELFQKYQSSCLLSKGIYQYNGHSFLIDKDIIGMKVDDEDVCLEVKSKTLYVSYNNSLIKTYQNMSFQDTIIKYMMILLGDMING